MSVCAEMGTTPGPDRCRVFIFDTTLCDGAPAAGNSMTPVEKLHIAQSLSDLGVDIIEAGFPAASPGDWETSVSWHMSSMRVVVCGLARCSEDDIQLAARALKAAPAHRLHVFLASRAIRRQFEPDVARERILHRVAEGVHIARDLCGDVEFSLEDASLTESAFLAEVFETAIQAGATTINVPDTAGFALPDEFAEICRYLRANVSGVDDVTLSVHCHNDLGMAVANSLAAVWPGPRRLNVQSMESGNEEGTAC